MKKLLLALAFLAVPVFAQAEMKLPPMSAGAYYSFKDHAINHMETFTAVSKWGVNLELGYAGDTDEADNRAVAALSYDIEQLNLKNYLDLPVLDLIAFRPALVAGLGNINTKDLSGAKFDWGVGATLISYKF